VHGGWWMVDGGSDDGGGMVELKLNKKWLKVKGEEWKELSIRTESWIAMGSDGTMRRRDSKVRGGMSKNATIDEVDQ
jgi:hypothetical protein